MDGVCLIASAVQRLSIKSVFGEVLHSCSYVDKAGMSLSLEAAGICDALLYHTIPYPLIIDEYQKNMACSYWFGCGVYK